MGFLLTIFPTTSTLFLVGQNVIWLENVLCGMFDRYFRHCNENFQFCLSCITCSNIICAQHIAGIYIASNHSFNPDLDQISYFNVQIWKLLQLVLSTLFSLLAFDFSNWTEFCNLSKSKFFIVNQMTKAIGNLCSAISSHI